MTENALPLSAGDDRDHHLPGMRGTPRNHTIPHFFGGAGRRGGRLLPTKSTHEGCPLGGDLPSVDAPLALALGESKLTESSTRSTQLCLVGAEALCQVGVCATDAGLDLEEKSGWDRPALEWEVRSDGALGVRCLLQHSQQRGGGAVCVAPLRHVVDYLPKLDCELPRASPRRSHRMRHPRRCVSELEVGRNHR